MLTIHDTAAVDTIARDLRIDPTRVQRLRNAFFKKRLSAAAALDQLPEAQAGQFAGRVEFHALRLHSRHDSQLDGATRLIFRTAKEHLVESVILRIASGRTALCVSCQVGCAARCAFCATGQMGMAHQLSAAEILDQVVQANQRLRLEGRRIRNVVFMGMGEPLHNIPSLNEAISAIVSPRAFDLSERHVGVSTVGIPDAMVEFARRWPRVRLALSLHSARQDVRERIIPLAGRYSLDELRRALVEVTAAQGQSVMIEYLLLAGVNDTAADAAALVDYLGGIAVHVNLIPFNPIPEAPQLAGTDEPGRRSFAQLLKAAGLRVTTRYSLGADIAAACGQLVRHENRKAAAPVD